MKLMQTLLLKSDAWVPSVYEHIDTNSVTGLSLEWPGSSEALDDQLCCCCLGLLLHGTCLWSYVFGFGD